MTAIARTFSGVIFTDFLDDEIMAATVFLIHGSAAVINFLIHGRIAGIVLVHEIATGSTFLSQGTTAGCSSVLASAGGGRP